MKKKSPATIREERELAEQIAKAHAFSAFLLHGPHDRRKVWIDEGGPGGYAKALAAAERLNAQSEYGRRAIVYAINPLGSFDVTPDLARMAGLV